jgi:hypothetical protein
VAQEFWVINHFTQSNPAGPGQADVPRLLRRVADSIEKLDGAEVQDITFSTEVTAEGDWPSLTVYFHAPEPEHDKAEPAKRSKHPKLWRVKVFLESDDDELLRQKIDGFKDVLCDPADNGPEHRCNPPWMIITSPVTKRKKLIRKVLNR